jgi:hypothetical protein
MANAAEAYDFDLNKLSPWMSISLESSEN